MQIGSGSATYSRASSETYTASDNSATLAVVTSGNIALPAYPFATDTTGNGGYQVYGKVKNWILQSKDFTTTWSAVGSASISANTSDVTDPYGTNLAEKIVCSGSGDGVKQASAVATNSGSYRRWVGGAYVRTASGTVPVTMTLEGDSGDTPEPVTFDFTATTAWQRLPDHGFTTFTAGATGNVQIKFTCTSGAGTFYIISAQLEKGYDGGVTSANTGYLGAQVDTTTAVANQVGDFLYYPSANMESAMTQGTITACVAPSYPNGAIYNGRKIIAAMNTSAWIELGLEINQVSSTYNNYSRSGNTTWSKHERFRVGMTWNNSGGAGAGHLAVYKNGSSLSSTTTATMTTPTAGNLVIGSKANSAYSEFYFDGIIKLLKVWSVELSASEMSTVNTLESALCN